MRYLEGAEEIEARKYMVDASAEAAKSICLRRKCGTVIEKNRKIIGRGNNSPPGGKRLETCLKDDLPEDFKSDKTCCVHAEQRAIMDALLNHQEYIIGSRLYFVSVNKNNSIEYAGKPYCTICSKMAFDSGIAEFVLWHEEGIAVYDTDEYNELSFAYRED